MNIEACLVRKGDILHHRGESCVVRHVRHCLRTGVTFWVVPLRGRARLGVVTFRPTELLKLEGESDEEAERVQAA